MTLVKAKERQTKSNHDVRTLLDILYGSGYYGNQPGTEIKITFANQMRPNQFTYASFNGKVTQG